MIFLTTLLWSSDQKPKKVKDVAVCPFCKSVTGFNYTDLEHRVDIPRCIKGRKAVIGHRGVLTCANSNCKRKFKVECKS